MNADENTSKSVQAKDLRILRIATAELTVAEAKPLTELEQNEAAETAETKKGNANATEN